VTRWHTTKGLAGEITLQRFQTVTRMARQVKGGLASETEAQSVPMETHVARQRTIKSPVGDIKVKCLRMEP